MLGPMLIWATESTPLDHIQFWGAVLFTVGMLPLLPLSAQILHSLVECALKSPWVSRLSATVAPPPGVPHEPDDSDDLEAEDRDDSRGQWV